MSLKFFHLVFIVVSILLCFGFGVWLLASNAESSGAISVGGAIVSFAAGLVLIGYAKRFLQKFKKVSYL